MNEWHGGKGDKQRPVAKKKFDSEFDRIFGNDKKTLQEQMYNNKSSSRSDLPGLRNERPRPSSLGADD